MHLPSSTVALGMPKETKPHDTFFKHRFSHKEAIEGFLRNRLPPIIVERLDFNTLKKQPDSFLPSEYIGGRDVDVLWSVQTHEGEELELFLHFEAQGTSQQMARRILIYQALIGEAYLRENKGATKIPTIITFVLYHGKRPWVGARSIAEAYKDFKQQVLLGYETPFLINLKSEPEKNILADGPAASAELVLSAQANGSMLDMLFQALKLNTQPCCEQATIDYYLLTNKGKEAMIFDEISKFAPEKANHYRNMFESVKEHWKREFIQRGKQQGVTSTLTSLDTILKGKGLHEDLIKEIEEELRTSVASQASDA